MRILVACEFSGRVREAFRRLGHDAWSCDLLPADDGSAFHIQGDVFEAVELKDWDMLIAFPPCIFLTVSANAWFKDQPPRESGALVGAERRAAREEAVAFFMRLYHCGIERVAIENPIGIMSSRFRQPDQIIQPWQYGHDEKKATCLWLKDLPKLTATNIVALPELQVGQSSRSLNRLDHLPESPERWKLRSCTFQGIANAMSDQWGKDAK